MSFLCFLECFFCFGLQENSLFQHDWQYEIICCMFSQVLKLYFLSRIFTPVIFWGQVNQKAVAYFHYCFVRWSSYLSSLIFGSDISVSWAEICLKLGKSTAVCCNIPSVQSQFGLHCVQRMLYTVKTVWIVECQFIE